MMYLGSNPVGLNQDIHYNPHFFPAGYTPMMYIQSSGTQCIDTGIYTKLSSKFIFDGNYLSGEQGSWAYLFGSANPFAYGMVIMDQYYPGNGTTYSGFGNVADKTIAVPAWSRNIITLDKNKCIVKNIDSDVTRSVDINATSLIENPNNTICIFGRKNNGVYERFSLGRVYEYQYYENDVLLRHMYPAKRNSDNVLGMFDIINNVFYTNVGNGEFTGKEF